MKHILSLSLHMFMYLVMKVGFIKHTHIICDRLTNILQSLRLIITIADDFLIELLVTMKTTVGL